MPIRPDGPNNLIWVISADSLYRPGDLSCRHLRASKNWQYYLLHIHLTCIVCVWMCHTWTHGLPSQSLKDVFHANVVGELTYCVPAWHGFCLASDYTRLNSFLRRAVKLGYDKKFATVTDLFDDADDAFFRKILYNKQHVIHTYLPERSDIVYTLRSRQHKNLIPKTSHLNNRHFLIRLLYKDCY